MPDLCNVVGCSKLRDRDNVRMFRLPKIKKRYKNPELIDLASRRQLAWLQALRKTDATKSKDCKVCSRHFISGMCVYEVYNFKLSYVQKYDCRFSG